jgi:DNA-binding FadR family transcriptional regulator
MSECPGQADARSYVRWHRFFLVPVGGLEIQVQIDMTRAVVEEHERVIEAIKSGQPEAAEVAMRDHFAGSLQRYRERFGELDPCN